MVFIFFFFLLLGPPKSTLFPYTTLFRSRDAFARGVRSRFICAGSNALLAQLAHVPVLFIDHVPELNGIFWIKIAALECLDRKSTRLNSSHQIISYAVFCLKKKNTLLKHK